jgi:hypothetical protein
MKACSVPGILLLLLMVSLPAAAQNQNKNTRATVIYDDRATEVAAASFSQTGASVLWLTTADLTRATGFAVKPQGVCRDELCFPLPKARMQEFLRPNSDTKHEAKPVAKTDAKHDAISGWFNLTAFAALVHQPVAHDAELSMWYFGLRSDQQQRLASLRAPDFTLPDMAGKMHSLADFRGKKVFLVTWASW